MNKKLINILTLVGAIIVFLIIMEVGVRLFIHVSDNMWQSDSTLGKKYIPNKEGMIYSNEYSNKIKINNEGFNDRNYNVSNSKNVYRILIIGDSFTSAVHVPLNQTFQELMEKNLSVEVIALGAGGYGQANEYFLLKDYGLKYHPNLTILMFFSGNDIRNNVYELEGDKNRPYFIMNNSQLQYIPFTPYTQSSWKRFMMENSKLANYLFIKFQRLKNVGSTFPKDYFIYQKDYNQVWDNGWSVTLELISEMKKMTEQSNSKFLLVSIPAKEQVDYKAWKNVLKQYPEMSSYQWDLLKTEGILDEYCDLTNTKCVFLHSEFQHYENNSFYFPIDMHFNTYGHQVVAEVLEEEVSQWT